MKPGWEQIEHGPTDLAHPGEARPTDLAAVWDALAGDRDAIFGHPTLTWEEGIDLSRDQYIPLLNDLEDGSTVLDLGCGTGRLTALFAATYPRLWFVGVDISKEMLRRAPFGPHLPNLRYFVGDARYRAQNPVEMCDGVCSTLMLQHLDHEGQRAVLGHAYDALRPGGWFRFQWVHEGEESELSHPTPIMEVIHWCSDAGFDMPVAPLVDAQPEFPTWAWITARKRA